VKHFLTGKPLATALGQPSSSGGPATGQELPPAVTQIADIASPVPFPPETLAAHDGAEAALLDHVRANRGHYFNAIWRAMDPIDRLRIIGVYGGALGLMVENEILGFVGDQIALPFESWRVGGLEQILDAIQEMVENEARPSSRTVTVPTRGIDVQSRLGD
jgi:hypothetical protein